MLLKRLRASDLIKSGGINLFGKVGTAFIGLLANVYIAREYGSEIVGKLALVHSLLAVSGVLSVIGANTAVLRFIPEHYTKYSYHSSERIFRKLQRIVLASATGVISVLLIFGQWFNATIFKDFDQPALYYASVALILFHSLHILNLESLRALKSVKRYSAIPVFSATVNIVGLVAFTRLVNNDYYPIYLFFFVSLLNFTFSGALSRKLFARKRSRDKRSAIKSYPYKLLLKISLPMFLTAAMHIIISQTDVLMIGYFLSDEAVGVYAVCTKIALLISFVLVAINAVVAPQFSEFFFSGNIQALNKLAQRASRLTFIITLPLVACIVVGGRFVLSLFGSEFESGYWVLIILAAGQLVNALSGSVGVYLNMIGQQNVYQKVVLTAAVLNVVLNLIFIPMYGLAGAAIASMVAIAFQNIASAVYIKTKLNFNITAFRF